MRTRRSLVILVLGLAGLAGCSSLSTSAASQYEEPVEFPIIWQKSGSYCSRTSPLRLVARNKPEMALCPIADVPVDFDHQMVLVAVLGRVTSDQYAIRIRHVRREGAVIRVDVQVFRPIPSTQPTIKLACPYHVVVVPRSDLNVEGFSPDPRRATKVRGAHSIPGL